VDTGVAHAGTRVSSAAGGPVPDGSGGETVAVEPLVAETALFCRSLQNSSESFSKELQATLFAWSRIASRGAKHALEQSEWLQHAGLSFVPRTPPLRL
jgi:hypothetical protein